MFTTQWVTVYRIDPTRAHEMVQEILGEEFDGVLHWDCFLAYDPSAYPQQKCPQHLLGRSDEISPSKRGRAAVLSRQGASLLRAAIHLKHRLRDQNISPHGHGVARGRLERALDRLLQGNSTDPYNAKLARLLRKHREHLLVSLYDEDAEPTNARAEQEIRSAVAVPKLSACNRHRTGGRHPRHLDEPDPDMPKAGREFPEVGDGVVASSQCGSARLAEPTARTIVSRSDVSPHSA